MAATDWTRPLVTRDGAKVRLYDTNDDGSVHGAYYSGPDRGWIPMTWNINGHFLNELTPRGVDVVNE